MAHQEKHQEEQQKAEQYKEPWEMLSDEKIWHMLGNPEHDLSADYIRLLAIELFSRVKKLEIENNSLKVILFETGLVDEETFTKVRGAVKDFFKEYDKQKAKEVDFYAKSGIPFTNWVNFMVEGSFKRPS